MSDERKSSRADVTEPFASKDRGAIDRGGSAPVARSSSDEVAKFAEQMRDLAPTQEERGRLIFALDATMSREPTWDLALSLQSDMFEAVGAVGGLDVQLMYFRGAGEARASRWVSEPSALGRLMRKVACHGGFTQIAKVLGHARSEARRGKVSALVYVGDAVEEDGDHLAGRAGELALFGVPMFLFQEGSDPHARRIFRELARVTKGAHCCFDAGSADQLKALLTAVAVYAAGGRSALRVLADGGAGRGARLLLDQLKP